MINPNYIRNSDTAQAFAESQPGVYQQSLERLSSPKWTLHDAHETTAREAAKYLADKPNVDADIAQAFAESQPGVYQQSLERLSSP
ncbi:MAG: hypothetical protein O2962_08700, partial [Cyanobacteria bacterium]|nr:hypothetical protein [Cyanobacteriota bacterium]